MNKSNVFTRAKSKLKPYLSPREWKREIIEWNKLTKIYLDAKSHHYFDYSYSNFKEFLYLYEDIFIKDAYSFSSTKKSPVILDCGSHIGMSVLYFKLKYPHARITAFEPNPRTYDYLIKNLHQNQIENVIPINAALAAKDGLITFYTANNSHGYWSWGDSGVKSNWPNLNYHTIIKVPSVKLSSFINQPIDLLKVDVESMELEVFNEIKNKLYFVKEIILEFHGSKSNRIESLLILFREHNFSYVISYYQGEIVEEKKLKNIDSYLLIVHAKRKSSVVGKK